MSKQQKALGVVKYSKFQLSILTLYREFVRLATRTPGLLDKVRHEFRSARELSVRTDSLAIDYKLRRARNQLDMLKSSRVQAVATVQVISNTTTK